jgi:hypothetical protein
VAIIPFSNHRKTWKTGDFGIPWQANCLSIFEFVKSRGGSAIEGNLPDERTPAGNREIRFTPGLADALFGGKPENSEQTAHSIFALIKKVLKAPTDENIAVLYGEVSGHSVSAEIDDLVGLILSTRDIDFDHLHQFFRWIAKNAPDREAVKIAIAVLGIFRGDTDRELFFTLGRHDEFTLYATVALLASSYNPEKAVWELAKTVHGWGRIQSVERLKGATDPEIRKWLVRGGFRNEIMDEYLAHLAAVTGDLAGQLDCKRPDNALLDGAAGIFVALVRGGVAEDITEYVQAPETYDIFLGHIRSRTPGLERLHAVALVAAHLSDSLSEGNEHLEPWSEQSARKAVRMSNNLLDDPATISFLTKSLSANGESEFWTARAIANLRGIDTWGASFKRHTEFGDPQWYFLMRTENEDRIDKTIRLAMETIPLEQVATGPELQLGLGAEFQHQDAVRFIVQDLGPYAGKGWPIVKAALCSSVIGNRNTAVRTLSAWGKDNWPGDVRSALQKAIRIEPDDSVKERMQNLL